jgi:hypothetical protein
MATSEQIITADPERIRAWAQERGGTPMKKRGTGHSGMDPAILGMAFEGGREDPSLEPIDWERFDVELDEQRLAAIMHGEGAESTMKIVRRDRVVMTAEPE